MTEPPELGHIIDDIEGVLNVQLSPGNWDSDPYMHGMANGMILCYGMLLGVDMGNDYKDAPLVWGSTLNEVHRLLRKVNIRIQVFGGLFIRRVVEMTTGITPDPIEVIEKELIKISRE